MLHFCLATLASYERIPARKLGYPANYPAVQGLGGLGVEGLGLGFRVQQVKSHCASDFLALGLGL